MAGGANAAVIMCIVCSGRAVRISEGIENDSYLCTECLGQFGIHWDEGPPLSPRWPPSPHEVAEFRAFLALTGKAEPVRNTHPATQVATACEKDGWLPCSSCKKFIPVLGDTATEATYVCPLCQHIHVGTALDQQAGQPPTNCYACRSPGSAVQCNECGFPRGFANVGCPFCKASHAVFAPHSDAGCSMSTLECVHHGLKYQIPCSCGRIEPARP